MAKKKTHKSSPAPNVRRRSDRDRRIRQSARVARVLTVLHLIQSRGRWTLQAIADELEWSTKTIRRDLEVLEFTGVPWYLDQHSCCRVRPDFQFPVLALTNSEAIGQAVATALTKAPGLNFGEGAAPTTRKLIATSSEEIQQILTDASQVMHVLGLQIVDHSRHETAIETVQLSLIQRKQLTGTYESPYCSGPVNLTIHPYRLCLIKRAWYVIGHIDGESEAKTLRIARFKSLRMFNQAASIPESFDLRKYFGNAWAVYRGEVSYDIELKFEPGSIRIVTETEWHPTQRVTKHKDGSITLKFTVDGLQEILRWILAWAGHVTVVRPDELKSLFRGKLKNSLAANS